MESSHPKIGKPKISPKKFPRKIAQPAEIIGGNPTFGELRTTARQAPLPFTPRPPTPQPTTTLGAKVVRKATKAEREANLASQLNDTNLEPQPMYPSPPLHSTIPTRSLDDLVSMAGGPAALLREIRRTRAESSLYEFVKQAWQYVESVAFVDSWHIRAICEHLQAVTRGDIKRLIINVPPRASKSTIVSVLWPAWVWAQPKISLGPISGPHTQMLFASYAQTLAERDAVKCRRLIESKWYQENWGETFAMVGDQNTKRRYETDKRGYRIATSVGGTLTGEGANLIVCFAEGTLVATPRGPIPIEILAEHKGTVWALDHSQGKVVERAITASNQTVKKAICEIQTASGLSLKCTPDHPIFAEGRGYIAAETLRLGDRVIGLTGAVNGSGPVMRHMPKTIHKTTIRNPQGIETQSNNSTLLEIMCDKIRVRAANTSVFGLRWQEARQAQAVLFSGLQNTVSRLKEKAKFFWRMCVVRDGIFAATIPKATTILFPHLRKLFPQSGYGWFRQPTLCFEQSEYEPYSEIAPFNSRTRWEKMCDLWENRSPDKAIGRALQKPSCSASYRSLQESQLSFELNNPMPWLPQNTPSWAFDEVTRITVTGGGEYRVYDITVAECHNLFANGILAHNCDDPLNAHEAVSKMILESTNRWWDESMSTRLNSAKDGAFVIIMQRLHEDDTTGHILAKDKKGAYTHLMLPMRYDARRHCTTYVNGQEFFTDPRVIEGELLCPERFPDAQLRAIEADLGPFGTSGQMQQTPVPAGGGIINREYWQVWPPSGEEDKWTFIVPGDPTPKTRYPDFDYIFASCDTAYTEKDENDWSACTVWGTFTDARDRPRIMLISAWRTRMELNDLVNKIIKTATRPGLACNAVLVENKASGHSVAQELKRLARQGDFTLYLVDPKRDGGGDKVARMYAAQPSFASGLIFAPDTTWAELVISECEAFPKGKYDDLADCCSMAVNWLRKRGMARMAFEHDEDIRPKMWQSQTGGVRDLYEI